MRKHKKGSAVNRSKKIIIVYVLVLVQEVVDDGDLAGADAFHVWVRKELHMEHKPHSG